VDFNLEKLKREVADHLESSDFAVFQSIPHGLEGLPIILWDAEREPDFRMFLDVARKAGVKIVLFATAEFRGTDLDDLEEHLEEAELTRDEQREFQSRIRDLRVHEGVACSLELAFDYNSRLYVYDVQPDWYDDFVSLEEEIMERASDNEIEDEDDSLGGYFSKN